MQIIVVCRVLQVVRALRDEILMREREQVPASKVLVP